MLVATVQRCPVFGGKVRRVDAEAARRVKGVRRVVEISSGVAVIADDSWSARCGREALRIEWDEGPNAGLTSAEISRTYARLAGQPGRIARRDGDPAAALGTAATAVEAVYEVPFLAHATMEPMNCTAHVRADRCDVWVAHPEPDGHPASVVGPSLLLPRGFPLPSNGVDRTMVEGAANMPYAVPNVEVDWVHHDPGVPVGFWRSVGASQNAFVVESFIDELAHAAGKDPVEYRRALLGGSPRHREVLEAAARQAGWGTPLPPGRARGIAVAFSYGSYAAQVPGVPPIAPAVCNALAALTGTRIRALPIRPETLKRA